MTATKRPASSPTTLHDLNQLRAEVRELGAALGRVVKRLEGPAAFDTVEQLRTAAKAARAGDASAAKKLSSIVAALDAPAAFAQAMAFNLYFELTNLAEENFRVTLLRQRRAARLLTPATTPPQRESIEAAILELKQRGVPAAELQRLLDRVHIELVFTAHPTESKRRTLLTKLHRLAAILRHRTGPAHAALEFLDPALIEREIVSLWLTDRARVARPTVMDEARTGLWYHDMTLYDVLPRLQVDLARALALYYPEVKAPARWLTFGSWIGGDRDGNPNVTAAVTAEVLLLHRRLAIEKMRVGARTLSRSVTVSDRRDAISPALRKLARGGRDASEHIQEVAERYPHEPYRRVLAGLRERLGQAVGEIGGPEALTGAAESPPPTIDPTAIRQVLDTVHASLSAGRAAPLADGDLRQVSHQLEVFGLHTARLDLRQHSSWHEAAIAELLDRADYPKLSEEAKLAALTTVLAGARPLAATEFEKFTPATRAILDPLLVATRAATRCGREALGIYIISMTNAVSDVLEVVLLQRVTGADLPIAPLFETLEDLQHAPAVLRALFATPAYAPCLAAHARHQHVMLGYSDSNKDCGYVAANWALYQAQETVVAACTEAEVRVTLFHGRGGSIARGGGPAAKAILAQPAGLRDGGIRITEQGEVLSTRYHDADLAHRILEQMAYGVLLATHAAQQPAAIPAAWSATMEQMSAAGFAAYKALVHDDPEFLHFWKQATPIDEIANLKLGSRPSFRRATTSVADLRAIPWVFSWMQSRFNFPGWYGFGTALEAVLAGGPKQRKLLREMYAQWPFFATLVDNAQLTLRKADMGIARLYSSLVAEAPIRERIFAILEAEFARTERALCVVTGQRQLLASEPVLRKSVELRNPYIDPLNYLQVEMLRRLRADPKPAKDAEEALRAVVELTINGISHGLKNTG